MGNKNGRVKGATGGGGGDKGLGGHGRRGSASGGPGGDSKTADLVNPWSDTASPHTYPPGTVLPPGYVQAQQRARKPFQRWEKEMLKTTFADLAARSATGKTIDKETFLKFFSNVPGLLGERLWTVFNRSGSGALDQDEFMLGLASYARGTMEQKVQCLFRMCNLGNSGRVSRAELETMCNHFVLADVATNGGEHSLHGGDGRPPAALLSEHLQQMKNRAHSPSFQYSPADDGGELARVARLVGDGTASEFKQDKASGGALVAGVSMEDLTCAPPMGNGPLSAIGQVQAVPSSSSSMLPLGRQSSVDDAISPSHLDPDWLHSSRVQAMVDDAFETGPNSAAAAAAVAAANATAATPATHDSPATGAVTVAPPPHIHPLPPRPSSAGTVSKEGLTMYQFGRWLQMHPEILDVLDSAFVGKEGLAYLDEQQLHPPQPPGSGGNANSAASHSSHRGGIVGMGPDDADALSSDGGLSSSGRFSVPSLLTLNGGGLNGVGLQGGTSANSSPFHGSVGGQPHSHVIISDPHTPPAITHSDPAFVKSEEKATWKNGPRLSVSGGGPLVPMQLPAVSTRATSASLGGRFISTAHHGIHATAPPTTDFATRYTSQSCSGSPATAGLPHLPHYTHPHFHCDHCGFDLPLKFCMGCGHALTNPPPPAASAATLAPTTTAAASTPTPHSHCGNSHYQLPTSSSQPSASSAVVAAAAAAAATTAAEHSCSHCSLPYLSTGGPPRFCPSCGVDAGASCPLYSRPPPPALSLAKVEPPLHKPWLRGGGSGGRTTAHQPSIEGYLKKVGARLKNIISRWFVISGNFLYTYARPSDFRPTHVLFLEGCFVEAVNHEDRSSKLRYGIEIILSERRSPDEPRKSRCFYASSHAARQQWLECIRVHANVHDFDEYYDLGAELGVGRFSTVRACRSKASGKKYAVKVIEKAEVTEAEREALRTEVAVLRLVHHPSIIRLKNVFETRKQIFIVMSYVRGGDLFDRLVARKRFAEHTTQAIISHLLQAVQWLHSRGIVHRDLKPENIMLVSEKEDTQIVLADLGLGAFALPDQAMTLPCGTLTFTAPEVLTGKGYGVEVDLWSIGVITFLLLRGTLPFDGKQADDIRDKIVHGRYSMDHALWEGVSEECRSFVRGLLTVDPAQRLTCEQALAHPWFKVKCTPPAVAAAAAAAAAAGATSATMVLDGTTLPSSAASSAPVSTDTSPMPLSDIGGGPALPNSHPSTPTHYAIVAPSPLSRNAPGSAAPAHLVTPSPSIYASSPLPPRVFTAYDSSGPSSLHSTASLTGSLPNSLAGSLTGSLAASLSFARLPADPLPLRHQHGPIPIETSTHLTVAGAPGPGSPPSAMSPIRIMHYGTMTSPADGAPDSASSPHGPSFSYSSPQPHLLLSPHEPDGDESMGVGAMGFAPPSTHNARDSDDEDGAPPHRMFDRAVDRASFD